MIRIFQQTSHDVMLSMSIDDCEHLANVLAELHMVGEPISWTIYANSRVLGFKRPKKIELTLRCAEVDRLHKKDDQLYWDLELDTIDQLRSRLDGAIEKGQFIPAELIATKGRRGEWLRLYAEVTPD